MTPIAFFVSPHGFGHAARAAAVANALAARHPAIHVHFFTMVPRWFFEESLVAGFSHYPCESDVGLVQASPLVEDLVGTVERLEASPWSDPTAVDALASTVIGLGCRLVMADISPLGLRVAGRARLPSVLVENFTWDWIYDRMPAAPPALRRLGRAMAGDFASAGLSIAAEPVCEALAGSVAVPPVARAPRVSREAVRRQLGVPDDAPMVVASMGGIAWDYGRLERLTAPMNHTWFVVPGGAGSDSRRERVVQLPFRSRYYHPDLVTAADAVIGKLGYSTVAEASRGGTAMAYVARPGFPESAVLATFVERHLNARELDREAFESGDWLPTVEELLAGRRNPSSSADGAAAAAKAIVARFPEVFE